MEQVMVIALLLLVNNEIKEARLQPDLSSCLKGKRIANRNISDNVEYRCIKTKAELELMARENGVELDLRRKKADLVKQARDSFK